MTIENRLFLFCFSIFMFCGGTFVCAAERFEFEQIEMAVPVRMVVYAPTREIAETATKEAYNMFSRLNTIMSDYDRESEIIRVAQRGDTTMDWLPISDELYTVLAAARVYSEASDGAFEVSVSPIVQLWRRARRMRKVPTQEEIETVIKRVGREYWELDDAKNNDSDSGKRIRFKQPGVRFDLGGIAKGYAVDQAFEILQKHGLKSCLVDAGGDMRLGNPPPKKDGWSVGFRLSLESNIPAPSDGVPVKSAFDDVSSGMKLTGESLIHEKETSESSKRLYHDIAIAASGDTFQYFILEGKRYSHIVDPRSGKPLVDSKSVTVFAATAMQADAVASALSVLDEKKWNGFLKNFPDVRVFEPQDNRK